MHPMKVYDIADILDPDAVTEPHALEVRRQGSKPVPVPDDEVYPGLMDTPKLNQSYVIFMKGGSFEDCAVTTGADLRTVTKWAQQGGWLKVRAEIERAAGEEEAQRLDMLRREERLPELKKQIDAGKKLRERVADLLDSGEELSPGNLKMLGDALKAAGDNTVRALGVSEAGSTNAKADEEKSGKAPLVVLIQGGGLPPVRIANTTDV
jgi:hypothetical protein